MRRAILALAPFLLAATTRAEEPPVPRPIAAFREALKRWTESSDPREKREAGRDLTYALLDLKDEPDERVLDCLFDAMEAPEVISGHHGESSTHSTAIWMALERKDGLRTLIEKSGGRGAGGRGLVVRVIHSRRDPEGIDFLLESAGRGADCVPFSAASALEAIPGDRATAALASLLPDSREAVFREYDLRFERWDRLPKTVPYKFALVHPLWVILRPDCIQISNITDIRESQPLMRVALGAYALRQLEHRGTLASLKDLEAMLKTRSLRLQLAAARQLGEYFPVEARALLADLRGNPYLEGQCAEVLARRGDGNATRTLLDLSRNEDLLVRVWAIQALAETPTPDAQARVRETAGGADSFLAQAAIAALRRGRREIPANAHARAFLSWDSYLCREAQRAAVGLDPESRARLAASVLEGEPTAPPEGDCPDDTLTAGGEAEPGWEGEGFRGDSMTYGTTGSIESAFERMRRFQDLAEGTDGRLLHDRGREIFASLPVGPEVPLDEDEDWNEPRRALAIAAIALAPKPEDLPLLLRWADSLYPQVRLAAARGLGALGGAEAETAILKLHESAAAERNTWSRNPLYSACVAALAECGTPAAREKFLSLSPWVLYPEKNRFSTYVEVEDVSSFVEGMVRSRFEGREETLRRTRIWVTRNASESFIRYEIAPRFWAGLLCRHPKTAGVLALETVESDQFDAVETVIAADASLDPVVMTAVLDRCRTEKRTEALRLLHARDATVALDLARELLSEPDRKTAGAALDFLLEHGDADDVLLLSRRASSLEPLGSARSLALRRFQARFATK